MSDTFTELSPIAQLFSEFAGAQLPTQSFSPVLENSHIALSGMGYLVSLVVNNTNVAAQFIQLFDANALPANGAAPNTVLTVPGSSDKFISWPLPGRLFLRGIIVCNSSTAATKTIGSADCFFDVQYIPVDR